MKTVNLTNKTALARRTLGAGVAIAAVMAMAGCGAGSSGSDTITLGIPVPLSGEFAVYGEQQKQATELALAEANKDGGIDGKKIKAIYADTRGSAGPARDQVAKLLNRDKVDALVGTVSSAVRDAIMPTVARAKKPYLYPTTYEGGTAKDFEGKGSKYLFTTGPVSEEYVKPFVPYLVKNAGKKFYMVGMDYSYGHKTVENAKRYVTEAGGEVVGTDFTPLGTNDFGAVLNRVAKLKPDVLFVVVAGSDLEFLLKQYRSFDLDKAGVTFATTELDESYFGDLSPQVLDGVYLSLPYFVNFPDEANKTFLSAMRAKFGDDVPVGLAAESQYYSVKMYLEAVKKAGSTDSDKVIKALEKASIDAPQGKVSIRAEDHQALMGDAIAVVKPTADGPRENWISVLERVDQVVPSIQGNSRK